MTRKVESVWIYLGELLAAFLLLVGFNLLIGEEKMSGWLALRAAGLTNLLLFGAAATAVPFGAFFAILATDFGAAMRRARAAKDYVVAFAFPLLLFATTLALVSLGSTAWGSLYVECCVFLLTYSAINLFTMVKNVVDLVGLWQDYERARKEGKRPSDS